jgi:ankyrin repeat protein
MMADSDRPVHPLIDAIWRRDVTAVDDAVRAGANPNLTALWVSALGWAVQIPDAAVREAITRALLNAGADPSQALPGVAFYGDERAIDALLSAGADVDARDSHGATALIVAAKYGHTKSLQRLCAAGAGVEQVDERGRSALLWLACRGDFADAAGVLIKAGANVNRGDENNGTPLTSAAFLGWTRLVDVLLAAGADPNLADGVPGLTPLMMAAERGHVAIVRQLLHAGADANQREPRGWTALMYASREGHVPVVQLLIEYGADVNAAAETGDSPLSLARYNDNLDVTKLLTAAGAR